MMRRERWRGELVPNAAIIVAETLEDDAQHAVREIFRLLLGVSEHRNVGRADTAPDGFPQPANLAEPVAPHRRLRVRLGRHDHRGFLGLGGALALGQRHPLEPATAGSRVVVADMNEKRLAFVPTYALPPGQTFGLVGANGVLYTFGSDASPAVPPGITYQRLDLPAGLETVFEERNKLGRPARER